MPDPGRVSACSRKTHTDVRVGWKIQVCGIPDGSVHSIAECAYFYNRRAEAGEVEERPAANNTSHGLDPPNEAKLLGIPQIRKTCTHALAHATSTTTAQSTAAVSHSRMDPDSGGLSAGRSTECTHTRGLRSSDIRIRTRGLCLLSGSCAFLALGRRYVRICWLLIGCRIGSLGLSTLWT